jgi:hypothetical protein
MKTDNNRPVSSFKHDDKRAAIPMKNQKKAPCGGRRGL